MARIVMTILGLVLLALGIVLIVCWSDDVAGLLRGALALGVALFGLVALIFGISEIAGAQAEKKSRGNPPQSEDKAE